MEIGRRVEQMTDNLPPEFSALFNLSNIRLPVPTHVALPGQASTGCHYSLVNVANIRS
jgi:hypothetical protein